MKPSFFSKLPHSPKPADPRKSGKKEPFVLRLMNGMFGAVVIGTLITTSIVLGSIQLRHMGPDAETDSADTTVTQSTYCTDGTVMFRTYENGTCTIIGMNATLSYTYDTLEIPEKSPLGDTVIGIESDAFSFDQNSPIRHVILPDTLEFVGKDAFSSSAPIYHAADGLLYLGSEENPHMVLMGIADTASRSYAIHKDTRILADESLNWQGSAVNGFSIEGISFPAGLSYVGHNTLDQRASGIQLTYDGTMQEWCAIGNRRLDGHDLIIHCTDGDFYTSATAPIPETAYNHIQLGPHSYVTSGPQGSTAGDILFGQVTPIKHADRQPRRDLSEHYTMFAYTEDYPFRDVPHVLNKKEYQDIRMDTEDMTDLSSGVRRFANDYNDGKLFVNRSVVALLIPMDSGYTRYRVEAIEKPSSDNQNTLHITLARISTPTGDTTDNAWMVLIPLKDYRGSLENVTVQCEIIDASAPLLNPPAEQP